MSQTTSTQHSTGQSIVLHLLPGVLIGAAYYSLIGPLHKSGYPSIMSLMIAIPLVLIPFEAGYLLLQGKRRYGKFTFRGIISYFSPIPMWQYFLWIPILFILLGCIFTFLKPLDIFFQNHFFPWLPSIETGFNSAYLQKKLVHTYLMVAVFGAILGPVTEELYFRGNLLPAMKYAGKWAPLLHSFLFAIYHIWTPWMFITRTIGMIPLIFAVQRRNLFIGIIAHIFINTVDVIAGVIFIMNISRVA